MAIHRKSIFVHDDKRSAAEIVQENLNRALTTPAYDAEVRRLNNAWRTTGAQHDAMVNKQQQPHDGMSAAEAYKLKVANAHKGNK